MTSRNVWDAMQGIDEKWILDAAPSEDRKKSTKTLWLRLGAVAAGLLLIIGIAVLWLPGRGTADLDDILWGSGAGAPSANGPSMGENIDVQEFYGWQMAPALYKTVQRADEDTVIAVLVVMRGGYGERDAFVVDGVSYGELRTEQVSLMNLRETLLEFLKVANELKYGEALYTTGTPDGKKWSKEHYDETVARIGEDYIARYIVDGEVQMELINQDLLSWEDRIGELSNKMVVHNEVYEKSFVPLMGEAFTAAGAQVEIKNGYVFLFVTKAQLAELEIADKGKYYLSHANRALYDGTLAPDTSGAGD